MNYYKRIDTQGKTTTVESYSHNLPVEGAVEINKDEYDAFVASLPAPPTPIDYKAQFAAASNANVQIQVIARKLGLV